MVPRRITDLQVTRDGSTWRDLRCHLGGTVLVRIAVSGGVDELEGISVIEQCVEDRLRIEDGHLVNISVILLKGLRVGSELRVVVGQ